MSGDQVPRILCHPDEKKSCGACCGIYNHVQNGADEIRRRLQERTRAYYETASIRDEQSLQAFRRRWEDGASEKVLEDLPSCPFLGIIDGDEEHGGESFGRVGCLVHPLQNDGIDGRDCGVFDRFVCDDYLCAAHDILRKEEVRLIIDAVDDSYLYGLVITNPRFVRSLLEIAANRTGSSPSPVRLRRPEAIEGAAACFELMRQWPYRGADGIFGPVQVQGTTTKRRRLPSEVLGVEVQEVDVLLVCLGTHCENVEELSQARQVVEARLSRFVESLRS